MLLLHGYPETHRCWYEVGARLAGRHTIVAPDLPGYGHSRFPTTGDEPFVKRAMAGSMVELMTRLGFDRFAVVGHDRGGRVAYRMTLDHPDVVTSLTVIDIVPTIDEWELIGGTDSVDVFHWPFLAQPAHVVEPMLAASPDVWLNHLFNSWAVNHEALAGEALDEYRSCFRRPEVMAGTCADYRTGAGADVAHDLEDRRNGRIITCPVLALLSPGRGDLQSIWQRWAPDVVVRTVAGGHFLPEENPEEVATLLLTFLGSDG